MIYSDFQGKQLSLLGFGTMRMPTDAAGVVDEAQVAKMVACAMERGVNYFDTAYAYHGGESERVIGRALAKYPRESFYLATKFPGHQISEVYDPAAVFEEQLEKCGVEYFDFYLLHNVYENSMGVYLDPRWGILDYFKEQKRRGRIHHLGFSSHGRVENLRAFLDICGADMEFCQIQLNYLDWTLQQAKEKYELLTERGIPVWVMEPVRGGKLATIPEEDKLHLEKEGVGVSAAEWAFRFLQSLPNVKMVLSGMSNLAQMEENTKTFAERRVLTERETELLLEIAEGMKKGVPCTACRYCCDGCPMGLDIPMLLSIHNDISYAPNITFALALDALSEDKKPSACVKCGKCAKVCPQGIDVPAALEALVAQLSKMPTWAQICREREEAAKRGRGEK